MNHAERANILFPLQHGFRKGRSCETQLIEFTDDITKNMENGKQTDVLIMDFSKAFDKVSHSLLLHKLDHYGIRGKTNRWIQSFLTGRSQSVVVEGHKSQSVDVESGVPQGSVLGPSLFLLYINDIPTGIDSTVRLFADDTVVYLTISSDKDCSVLQADLAKLQEWETRWKMAFHPDKCNVLSITRKKKPIDHAYMLHNQILQHVTSAKYLGVTFNTDMDFGQHINTITNKASSTLGFLRRNLNIGSVKVKTEAYQTYVRPTVEYASTVWDPHDKNDIRRLEMVQRRSARFVTNRYRNRSSVGEMLETLDWKSLEDRRKEARLIMMFKIDSQLVAIDNQSLIPPRRLTRHMHPKSFQTFSACTDYRKWSFFPRTVRDWNSLPPDIATARSLESFKTQLANHSI